MKIYKSTFILVLTLFAACQRDTVPTPEATLERTEMQFTGEMWSTQEDNPDTGLTFSWKEDAGISIFSASAPESNEEFTAVSVNGTEAVFKGQILPSDRYVAVTPYSSDTSCQEGIITTEIPDNQVVANGTISEEANVSVAIAENGRLEFKSACALLSFQVPDISSLKSAVFKGNNGEDIAGAAKIHLDEANISMKTGASPSQEILLTGQMEAGNTCFISTIPANFEKGFSMIFEDVRERKYTVNVEATFETASGTITSIAASDPTPEPLDITLPGYTTTKSETEIIRPGLMLSRIDFASAEGKPVKTLLYEIDLNQPDLSISQTTPYGETLGYDLQPVTEQALAADKSAERILGGTNSDFYDMNKGTNLPHGVFHHDGVCYKDYFNPDIHNWKMSFFYLTDDKKTGIGAEEEYPGIAGSLELKEVCGGADILIKDGVPLVYTDRLEPRTCLGLTQDGTKIFLMVADGRKDDHSIGMSLTQLAIYLHEAGSWDAMNLDGGGSSTFYIRDSEKNEYAQDRFKVLNRPSDWSGERAVANGLSIIELN